VRGAKPGLPWPPPRTLSPRRHPQARMLRARQRHGVITAPVSVHARRGRSGGKLNALPPNEVHPSAQQLPPRRGSAVSGPRFPIGLRGATIAYNANFNTTMRRVPPGRHVFVARDPGASAGDESSLGSLDALPPANLHGYAE
jgi:hypothetical protein